MITVLAHGDVKQFLSTRTKTYSESHGRISFNLSASAFQTLMNKLRENGINPFAAMLWEQI